MIRKLYHTRGKKAILFLPKNEFMGVELSPIIDNSTMQGRVFYEILLQIWQN